MTSKVIVGLGLLGAVLVLVLSSSQVGAEEGTDDGSSDASARAIQAWGKTCFKCHAVPDPAYETDRAFLHQVMDTT